MIKPSFLRHPMIWREKESRIRIPKPNSKLLSQKFKTSGKKSLLARRRTKGKGIMEREKSIVHTAGRDSILNITAWKINLMKLLLFLRKITSIFWKDFGGDISKIGNHNMKEVMLSWQELRSPMLFWYILELRITWWLEETLSHLWRPSNPFTSTWEMTPQSYPKDKVL